MNGYEVYCHYVALKLHFTSKTYDFFKYNGKVKSSTVAAFEKRKDKYSFHKLARNVNSDEIVPFMLANFLVRGKCWTKDLLEPEAREVYLKWRKVFDSLTYTFEQDLDKILGGDDGINGMMRTRDGEYPKIWTMMMQGEITMETVAILQALTGCLDDWDKKYSEDYIYAGKSTLIRKYVPFLGVDVPKMKKIVQKHLTTCEV